MRNLFHISLLLCLIALSNNIYHSVEHHASNIHSSDISNAEHTPWGDAESAVFSSHNPFLIVAEKTGYSGSEIDPRTFATANLPSGKEIESPQTLYLRHAEYILVSQSIRTLIYPFHSFL